MDLIEYLLFRANENRADQPTQIRKFGILKRGRLLEKALNLTASHFVSSSTGYWAEIDFNQPSYTWQALTRILIPLT